MSTKEQATTVKYYYIHDCAYCSSVCVAHMQIFIELVYMQTNFIYLLYAAV